MTSIRAYWQFVRPYRVLIFFTLLIGMIKFGIPLSLPLMMKYVVDDLLLGQMDPAEKIRILVILLLAALAVFTILRGPVEYYRQYFAQLVTSRILFDIRSKLYTHIQKLSMRYYQNHKVGEVISRFINDVEQTRNIVETGMMNIWLDMFTLSIALGVMFFLNPKLALVSILIFPLYGLAVKIMHKRLKNLTKERSQALADIQSFLHERIQGIPVIRSFTLERYDSGLFGKKNGAYLGKALAQTRWNALTFATVNTITDLAPLMVIGYGGYQVINGNLTVGSFVAFFGYLERLYSPLRRIVSSSTTLTQASASLDRVLEFMQEPYDIQDSPTAKPLERVRGRIEFSNVWFRYHDKQGHILKNINLEIEPGETVALVGMSGGGKSSLVTLLPRFYELEKGTVRIDGHDIAGVTLASLRRQIGVVFQDNILFSGSIRENILLGNPDASEAQMIHAAKAANAHDFIEKLPQGYETEIGERGIKLSGGQKQRVAIARVFLKDPRILILDEATSALDLESEQLIQRSLDELAKDRTTLIVAHRLSTITHADQIIVIEDGEITERGTHEQLMRRDGSYAHLYNIQHLTPLPLT